MNQKAKSKKAAVYAAICSILLFFVSLTQTAITYDDFNGVHTFSSAHVFISGAVVILGGGAFEWIIWMANPLAVIALILLFCNKKISFYFAGAASFLAFSFCFWNEILVSENGRMAKIESLNSGYILWLASMLVLLYGTIVIRRKSNPISSENPIVHDTQSPH